MLQAYKYDPQTGTMGEPLGKYTGPGEKATGANFQCGKNICWPIGKGTQAVWANLQRQTNRFATKGGFAKIDIDTFIGDVTVAAVKAVVRVTHSQSAAAKAVDVSASGSVARIAVSTWAQELETEFRGAADKLGLPGGVGAIVGVVVGEKPSPRKPVPKKMPGLVVKKKNKAIWWVVALVALAGVGTIGYVTYARSKKPPAKKKTARVRAPAFAR